MPVRVSNIRADDTWPQWQWQWQWHSRRDGIAKIIPTQLQDLQLSANGSQAFRGYTTLTEGARRSSGSDLLVLRVDDLD